MGISNFGERVPPDLRKSILGPNLGWVGETDLDFANLKEEARLVEILGAADVGGSGVSPNAEPNAS